MPAPKATCVWELLEDGTGEYEKAAEQFQQAVQLEPANDRAYTSLAGAYQHLNQPDKAEETYKRAIVCAPAVLARVYLPGRIFMLRKRNTKKLQADVPPRNRTCPRQLCAFNNLGRSLTLRRKGRRSGAGLWKDRSPSGPRLNAYNNIAVTQFFGCEIDSRIRFGITERL